MSVINILPLGNADRELVRFLTVPLGKIFHAEIAVLSDSIDMQRFYDEQRNQFNSTSILLYIKEHFVNTHALGQRHSHSKIFLAIAADDLFIPILTYVFGEAELGGNVAVASYYRLQNERYGLPANLPLLRERLEKEALHELGHVFGLTHCHSQMCAMYTSTYVGDIDLKGRTFCDECVKLLRRN
jgi:archaemetzincin